MMNALKNKVQLIGNLGQDPEIIELESGSKLAKFSIATNETYRNAKGEKITELTHRSYETKEGEKRYVTEIKCNELLMFSK
jgi:single-strand DNA-binding protein